MSSFSEDVEMGEIEDEEEDEEEVLSELEPSEGLSRLVSSCMHLTLSLEQIQKTSQKANQTKKVYPLH